MKTFVVAFLNDNFEIKMIQVEAIDEKSAVIAAVYKLDNRYIDNPWLDSLPSDLEAIKLEFYDMDLNIGVLEIKE